MKKVFLLAAVSMFAMNATQALAEPATATATGHAKATIVNDVHIVSSEDLDFGTIISTVDANQVTVKADDDTRTATVAGSLSPARTSKSGKFAVSGSPHVEVTLGVISPIDLTGTGAIMRVTNFTTSTDKVTLNANGEGEFSVGATLNVNAAQAAGEYAGDYTVTASY